MRLTASNTPGRQGLGGLPWLTPCHTRHHTSLSGELRVVRSVPLGKDRGTPAHGLAWTLSPSSFTFADFHRYPLAVINRNCERDCRIEGGGPVETALRVSVQLFYMFFHLLFIPR